MFCVNFLFNYMEGKLAVTNEEITKGQFFFVKIFKYFYRFFDCELTPGSNSVDVLTGKKDSSSLIS